MRGDGHEEALNGSRDGPVAVRSLPGRPDRARRAFGRPLTLTEIEALHTMTREQIAWFRAGSALNAAQSATGETRR